MPTYAYACTACDHRFEAHQAFSDASLTECPQCEGRLRKLFSSVGVVFKGSGFYRTDSRSGSNGSSSSSTVSSGTSTGSGSNGSSSNGSNGSASDGSSSSSSAATSSGSSSSSSSPQPAAAGASSTA